MPSEDGSTVRYVVHGPLFFGSSNDLVERFSYTLDPKEVKIDFTHSQIWDASSVAALDAVETKYRAHGRVITFIGLDPRSLAFHAWSITPNGGLWNWDLRTRARLKPRIIILNRKKEAGATFCRPRYAHVRTLLSTSTCRRPIRWCGSARVARRLSMFADLERAEAAKFYRSVGTLGRLFLEIEAEAFKFAN